MLRRRAAVVRQPGLHLLESVLELSGGSPERPVGVAAELPSETHHGVEGVSQLLRTLELVKARINPKIELLGVLLTMFDRRNKLSFSVQEEVQAYFGDLVFKTVIPRNVRLSESPSHGKPISLYDRRSSGAKAYQALAQELGARLEERASEETSA